MTSDTRTPRRQFLQNTLTVAGAALLAGHVPHRRAEAADAPAYEVGIYTRPWDQHDYRVALDAMAEIGFKHAGLMTTSIEGRRLVIDANISVEQAREVGREVKQRGLSIPSVYGGGIPVATSLEAGIEALKRLIDNCVAAGAKSLMMGGIGDAKLYDRYYGAIAECCDYAAEKKLAMNVKPHVGLNATGPQCRACIEEVGHDNFSLWYDPGNIFYYSQGKLDPVDDATTVDGLVRDGMCIKDFRMVERDGKQVPDVMLTPGTGRVEFGRVLIRLRHGGFTRGALVIETLARGTGTLPEIAEQAKIAKAFVDELVQSVA